MSKKNNNDNKELNFIKKTLDESRKEILNLLTKKYHWSKNDAIIAEESVYASTRSAMRQTYSNTKFQEYIDLNNTGIIKSNKTDLLHFFRTFPDLASWIHVASNIPYYQSLGDTLGYNNGKWEFNYGDVRAGPDYVNEMIYEFISLGGINDIDISNWMASDDTILYMATLETLVSMNLEKVDKININTFGEKLRLAYLAAKPLIANRHPGQITSDSLEIQENIVWNKLPYNSMAKGNGSVMRSGSIGIFFPGKHNRSTLVALAIESSRITHNSTIANLGSIATALFTAYALERVPVNFWPSKFLKLLQSNLIDSYMELAHPTEYSLYIRDKVVFIGQWEKYVRLRFSGTSVRTDQKWMKNPVLRYKYLVENFSKSCDIPGSCADDSVIMAYDALLEAGNVFEKAVVYSILHPGDSDTIGSMTLSWYGALYNDARNQLLWGDRFDELEFADRLATIGESMVEVLKRIFYRDIYLNIARKYLKQIVAK